MSLFDQITAPATAAGILHESDGVQLQAMESDLAGANLTIEHLQETLSDIELSLEDKGWLRLGMLAEQQFSRQGLAQAALLCRTMSLVNPLIGRGLALRTCYVWGEGVSVQARANGSSDGEQDVNAVVQAFLDDRDVRQRLTSPQARETNEHTLGSDGNLFTALFTSPRTGRVLPRLIPFEEITQVIDNPQDRSEPWFYQRISSDAQGHVITTYHPDIDYRPRTRILRFGQGAGVGELQLPAGEILWDAPILHLKVNAPAHWDFGIPDAFSAISWARMYQDFLVDWAKLIKALSRFAWKVTSGRKSAAQQAVDKLRSSQQAAANERSQSMTVTDGQAGATVGMVGANLEAVSKSGATIDSESGRPLASMVAAGLEVPVTMLLTDPGVTGARATAETLDKPTELMASLRQQTHGEWLRRLLDYVIDAAAIAPQGALSGAVSWDEWGRRVVTLTGDTTRSIEVTWPDLTELPLDLMLKAIQTADGIGKLPPLLIVKLLLGAFGVVTDADEVLAEVTDPETGEFLDPNVDAAATAAAEAVRRLRAGGDPAGAL